MRVRRAPDRSPLGLMLGRSAGSFNADDDVDVTPDDKLAPISPDRRGKNRFSKRPSGLTRAPLVW